jgi:hypothetical protein
LKVYPARFGKPLVAIAGTTASYVAVTGVVPAVPPFGLNVKEYVFAVHFA